MIRPEQFVNNYFDLLVSKFFKILPMKEVSESTLSVYIDSLCIELSGGQAAESLFGFIRNDAAYITLISIAFAIKSNPEMDLKTVRREVFHAISICNQLKEKYGQQEQG